MTTWHYIVLLLCATLLIFLIWKEVRRENRARLPLRVLAVVLVVVALACLALPLSYHRAVKTGGAGQEAVLMTEGADADSVRQFMQDRSAGQRVSYQQGGLYARVHVFGFGLNREDWDHLSERSALVFHPTVMRTGFSAIHWQQKLRPGQQMRIQGTFYRADDRALKIQLCGFGAVPDSISIGGGGKVETMFALTATPPQTGRAVYKILLLSGADTLEQESLPLEVLPQQSLRVLFLAAAPGFDNRYLADWCAQNGYAVAMRTAISKGKYDQSWLNMPQVGLDHVSATLLDKFDLVIADSAELGAMGPSASGVLWRQVSDKGMGLVIKVSDSSQHPAIRERPGTEVLVRDSLSRAVVSKRLVGSGKVVTTVLNATYVRVLAGQKKEYAALWSSVLGAAGKEDDAMEEWRFFPELPRVNEPVRVFLRSNKAGLEEGRIGESVVYLNQDPVLGSSREGSYWPGGAGWQVAETPGGDSSWMYVWAADDWKGLRRGKRLADTRAYMAEQVADDAGRSGKTSAAAAEEMDQRVLVAKGWFYAIFLICCLFLWVERKI